MAKTFQRRRSSVKKDFTEKELLDLRTAFKLLDSNEDGNVTKEELQHMLKKLDIVVGEDVLEDLIKSASHRGTERIDENDFLFWVKRIQDLRPDAKMDDESKDLLAAFKVFDSDNKGYITRAEVKRALDMIGEPVTDEELSSFLSMANTDQNGNIRYEEFSRLLL